MTIAATPLNDAHHEACRPGEEMPPATNKGAKGMTDAEAAKRLLDRHAREVAAHFDKENLHSAEDLMRMSVRRYLEMVVKTDSKQIKGGQ